MSSHAPMPNALPFDYDAYVSLFNGGRHNDAIDLFFADDALADLMDGKHRGREAIKARMSAGDDAISESLRPRRILHDASALFSDVDVVFQAKSDRPDFWLGSMKAGDVRTMRMFALYEVRDGKVATLTTIAKPDG